MNLLTSVSKSVKLRKDEQLALENVEAIASTAGVNSLMLGPGDLRVSLGLPSKRVGEFDHPKFLAAVDRLIQVSQIYRKPLMTVAFKVSARTDSWISKFGLLLTSADIISVVNGHRQELASTKQLLQTYQQNSSAAWTPPSSSPDRDCEIEEGD